jgi:hypothetical protein
LLTADFCPLSSIPFPSLGKSSLSLSNIRKLAHPAELIRFDRAFGDYGGRKEVEY